MPKTRLKQSKLKSLWRQDQTRIWSYCQLVGASALAGIDYLNSIFQSDQFHTILDKVSVPWYITVGIAAFALITFIAHEHPQ